jgi:hypothetical protein
VFFATPAFVIAILAVLLIAHTTSVIDQTKAVSFTAAVVAEFSALLALCGLRDE